MRDKSKQPNVYLGGHGFPVIAGDYSNLGPKLQYM